MRIREIMKQSILFGMLLLFILCQLSCDQMRASDVKSFPLLKGPYLGKKSPGLIPEIFAPGTISTGLYERDVAISPDGREIFFRLTFWRSFRSQYITILHTKYEDDSWTEPKVVSFHSDMKYYCSEPCLTHDGKKLLFTSNQPKKEQILKPGWEHANIWTVDRTEDGSWGEPYEIGSPINTENGEFFPSITKDGTLYFTRLEKDKQKTFINRSRFINGKYMEPEKLPDPV